MRLALRLGRTRRELLASISGEELTLWREFDAREPIGDARMDVGFGMVASTLANVHRQSGAEPFSPIDFMPFAPKQPETAAGRLTKTIRAFFAPLIRKKE